MNETALASFFAIITAISWGFSDFFGAKASKFFGATAASVYVSVISVLVYTPVYLLFMAPGGEIWSTGGLFAATGGAVVVMALLVFFRGLELGPVSAVVPITAAYPLFTLLIAIVVFNASLSSVQIAAISIVVIGILATSGFFELKKSDRRISQGPLLAIVASVLYGIGLALVAQGVERVGWETASFIQLLSAVVFLVALTPFLPNGRQVPRKFKQSISNKFIIGNAVIGTVGLVCLNVAFGFDKTSGAVVSAISACYPLITIVLALRHFREEARPIPLVGAAASIGGIILLSL